MAELDPNPELRAELTAAVAVIEPKKAELSALYKVIEPGQLRDYIGGKLTDLDRRLSQINTVLARLDRVIEARTALVSSGYPDIIPLVLPADLFAELEADLELVRLAGSLFSREAPQQAASITATLTPVQKT